jgi:hypothetical protein
MGLLDLLISGLRCPDDSARSSSSIILAMFGDELDLDNPRLSVDGSSFNFVVYFFGAVNKYDGFAAESSGHLKPDINRSNKPMQR